MTSSAQSFRPAASWNEVDGGVCLPDPSRPLLARLTSCPLPALRPDSQLPVRKEKTSPAKPGQGVPSVCLMRLTDAALPSMLCAKTQAMRLESHQHGEGVPSGSVGKSTHLEPSASPSGPHASQDSSGGRVLAFGLSFARLPFLMFLIFLAGCVGPMQTLLPPNTGFEGSHTRSTVPERLLASPTSVPISPMKRLWPRECHKSLPFWGKVCVECV